MGNENASEFGQEECKLSPGSESHDSMFWVCRKKKVIEECKDIADPFQHASTFG